MTAAAYPGDISAREEVDERPVPDGIQFWLVGVEAMAMVGVGDHDEFRIDGRDT